MIRIFDDSLFVHTIRLAFRAFAKRLIVTLLAVVTIAVGVGSYLVMNIVYEKASGFGINEKLAADIQAVAPAESDLGQGSPSNHDGLSSYNSYKLLSSALSDRPFVAVSNVIDRVGLAGGEPDSLKGVATTTSFFKLFGLNIIKGRAWNSTEEKSATNVVVISSELERRLFRGEGVGKWLQISGKPFEIVGVYGEWKPMPHFYALHNWAYGNEVEDYFVPLTSARESSLHVLGNVICDSPEQQGARPPSASDCAYLTLWTTCLDPESCLDAQSGLLSRGIDATRYTFTSLREYLEKNHVMPPFVVSGLLISVALLLICLASAGGIFVVKFDAERKGLAIRRALGATKMRLFFQVVIECMIYGACGVGLGALMGVVSLHFISQQKIEVLDSLQINAWMFVSPILVTFVCTVLTGIYPAWRACGNLNQEILGGG